MFIRKTGNSLSVRFLEMSFYKTEREIKVFSFKTSFSNKMELKRDNTGLD